MKIKMNKKEFDYFEQFQKMGKLAVEQSELFVSCVKEWQGGGDTLLPILERAHKIEHSGDLINHEVYSHAASDFVTPIEREDLLLVATSLDNVIDLTEDVINMFYIYDAKHMADGSLEFALLLQKSCKALNKSLEEFSTFKRSKKLQSSIIAINDCEEEADALYSKVMRELHTDQKAYPMRVIVWSRIFDAMEECCDACEHVADNMNTIMLRNS